MKPLRTGSDAAIQWSSEGLFVCDAEDEDSGVMLTMADVEALAAEIARVLALPAGAIIDPADPVLPDRRTLLSLEDIPRGGKAMNEKIVASLKTWRFIAIALLVTQLIAVITLTVRYQPALTQKPTSLILCDGVYKTESGKQELRFDHCASVALEFAQSDQCERAKEAAAWTIQSGLNIRPEPWVARSGLVLTCVPSAKLKNNGPSQPAG